MSEAASIPATLLAATVEHLARFAPFSEMRRSDLEWMAARMAVVYVPEGGILLAPEDGPVAYFYVIKRGAVVGEGASQGSSDARWRLTEGECFPLGALAARRPVTSVYRAVADTFCYRLPVADFEALLERSSPFRDFCTRRIAHLAERSVRQIQAQYIWAAADRQPFSASLGSLIRRAPVTASPDEPLSTVLARMHAENVGSVVVVEDGRPRGIFTLHDLLTRVAIAGHSPSAPVRTAMTHDPIALPARAMAFEAALAMARHGIRHVLVTEGDRLLGVISERDLFALQRVGLTEISLRVKNARGIEDLQAVSGDIRNLAHGMLAQGVGAEQLTQIVTTLNDLLTQRIVELVAARHELGSVRYCWLALGSEGRGEQTLATDQDNGLVFADGDDGDALRARLLSFAREVNEGLAACGFPLCKGGVMAGNSRWCLSLAEWQRVFADWIGHGDPEDLLNASIFFDFRPIVGDAGLAEALWGWLLARARATPRFLHQMAANALRNRPPLGVVRDFVLETHGDHVHTLDLKLNGATPFVDAARIYGLAAGVPQTNTVERLRAAAKRGLLRADEVEAWSEAFLFIQLLRMRNQHWRSQEGKPPHNHVDPDELNELERRILKESFRQARKLQQRLAMDYGL